VALESLRFDFGATFTNNNRTVAGEIARSLPATLEQAGAALAIVVVVQPRGGISFALWRNSLFDRAMRLLVFVGTAMPNYGRVLLMWLSP
jgi:nickel transport system permease protein